jgi:hypothetical protein
MVDMEYVEIFGLDAMFLRGEGEVARNPRC